LTVATTDIIKGEAVYFSSGTLSTAIIASSCIPVIFEPVEYQGYLLVDGGVTNNLPVEPIRGNCDKIIGIYVNSVSVHKQDFHMKDVLDRSLHCMMKKSITAKIDLCELFLEPPDMSNYSMFDFDKSEEIFNYGYDYALAQEEKILAFITKPDRFS
jgi:NTE family protein